MDRRTREDPICAGAVYGLLLQMVRLNPAGAQEIARADVEFQRFISNATSVRGPDVASGESNWGNSPPAVGVEPPFQVVPSCGLIGV